MPQAPHKRLLCKLTVDVDFGSTGMLPLGASAKSLPLHKKLIKMSV